MTYGIRRLMCVQDEKMAHEVDFGSGGEEDYLDLHSPTDSSEDSVEVKVSPITSLRNKRKCAEPRKVQDTFTGPLKKRMCLKVKAEVSESHPFRPWSPKRVPSPPLKTEDTKQPNLSDIIVKSENPQFPLPSFIVPRVPIVYQPNVEISGHKYGYFRPPSPIKIPIDNQPVPLVKKRDNKDEALSMVANVSVKKELHSPGTNDIGVQPPRVPVHPQIAALSTAETERLIINTNETFPSLQNKQKVDSCTSRREQRNYKNMTRERRIEANARERTRVHTISAAFETLRRSVPAYSHNQKLSKLSVLRIACSYIKTLSSIVECDDKSTSESVDTVSRTIQREGKLRKKKDDND